MGLQRVIEIARGQDFCRTVLDGPGGLLGDLITLLMRSPRDDYTDSLLTAAQHFEARRGAGPAPGGAVLSEREQEVLRCLRTRLTTREITAELFISMNTLKSHLKSINRKLGATSRADAVARAKALGLL
jgi:ATP/maltotriose-dependent transcriptional regulator MalT